MAFSLGAVVRLACSEIDRPKMSSCKVSDLNLIVANVDVRQNGFHCLIYFYIE